MKNNSRAVRVAVAALSVLLLSNLAEAQDVDVPGNLTMHDSADPTVGNVLKEGVPFLHNFGVDNTFIGKNAGNLSMNGQVNTALGANALHSNTTGYGNTACGGAALQDNTSRNLAA